MDLINIILTYSVIRYFSKFYHPSQIRYKNITGHLVYIWKSVEKQYLMDTFVHMDTWCTYEIQ